MPNLCEEMKRKRVEDSGSCSAHECLSPDTARALLRKCLYMPGRLEFRSHIGIRMAERGFDAQDVERVLRAGCISDPPEHCPKYGNWKYKIGSRIEGCFLEIVLVFDTEQDYDQRPLVVPLTGYWTGEGTLNGKRNDRQEKRDYRRADGKVFN